MTCRRANTDSCSRADRRWPGWLTALATFASCTFSAPPTRAHAGHVSYCTVETVAGGLAMKLEVPVAVAQQSPAALDVEGHVRATTPGGECALAVQGPGPSEHSGRKSFQIDFSCPEGPVTLSTDYGTDVERTAEVVCAIDGNAHVFRQGAFDYVVGTPPTLLAQLGSFLRLGALHVLTGLDHLLFVLSLLLGAACSGDRGWRPALRRLFGVVTGFTLGHSITLILAALGVWRLPAALTESLIALSIVLVAVQNLFEKAPRGRATLSAGFGLIHGFGFASALAQLGLPSRATVATLLAFNVGIELAQLLLVLVCFPALLWAGRRSWFRARLLVPGCCAVAGIAAVWFVERAFGLSMLSWPGS